MKELHFNLYNNSNVGLCNVLMSVENALLIAKLTQRDKIIFYGSNSLYNSSSKFQDIYDIDFLVEFRESNTITEKLEVIFDFDLHDTVLYYKDYPTKNFINSRNNIINLENFIVYESIGTLNNSTLGFYSYLFYLTNDRIELYKWLKESLTVKSLYRNISIEMYKLFTHSQKKYISYNSIHVRRGDYLYTNDRNKDIQLVDCLTKIYSVCSDRDKLLLVHTDEKNKEYFKDLELYYTNIIYIDDYLYTNYSELNDTELGIVSLLIASYSDSFIGTMKSTFTSFIQRYRLYNNLNEEFCFLYPQDERIQLDYKGRFLREPFAEFIWNLQIIKETFRNICFWFREWESCYPQPFSKPTELRLFPNFLTNTESQYIIDSCEKNKNNEPYHVREDRNRVILSCSNDRLIKDILIRSCQILGYQITETELSQSYLQVFVQYSEGQTFWHMDSLAPNHVDFSIRKRSILFYLNEDFTGSEISFPYLGIKFQPKKNTMITYPTINEFGEMNRLTSHSSSLLTKGKKYMCYFDIKYI